MAVCEAVGISPVSWQLASKNAQTYECFEITVISLFHKEFQNFSSDQNILCLQFSLLYFSGYWEFQKVCHWYEAQGWSLQTLILFAKFPSVPVQLDKRHIIILKFARVFLTTWHQPSQSSMAVSNLHQVSCMSMYVFKGHPMLLCPCDGF